MTRYLDIPGGRLAYGDFGSGPLVIAIPAMGDIRSTYRFLAPQLAAAGFRVISLDTRGHGDSSLAWDDYAIGAIAGDILAVIRALDAGPAHVIGNSMAAGAAVIAAAREPRAIRGLVLVGPFVRNVMPPWLTSLLFEPLLRGPWGFALWRMLFKKAFPAHLPADFAEERARREAFLAEPGRFAVVRRMAVASKIESEQRSAEVTAPVLVVMGTRDPDFSDPAKEAAHVGDLLKGSVVMIVGAGHYPHVEMPDAVIAAVVPFLRSVDAMLPNAGHAS